MQKYLQTLASEPMVVAYNGITTGNNDAYIPEMWAMEAVRILEAEVIFPNLVHTDFSNDVSEFGCVVNTRRPRKFKGMRKTDADCVEHQDAISDNIQVALNQHHYASFIIKDGEATKAFQDLVSRYLRPAVQAVARSIDRSIAGQVYRLGGMGSIGRVNGLTSATARQNIVNAYVELGQRNVPQEDLRLVLGMTSYGTLLDVDLFTAVDKSGREGALRRGEVGALFGFDIFTSNNVPCIPKGVVTSFTGTVDASVAAMTPAGTPIAVTLAGHVVQPGETVVLEGDDQPQTVVAAVDNGTDTTSITLAGATKYSVASGAAVVAYGSVQAATAYANGYSKALTVSGSVYEGQMVAVGVGANRRVYSVIEVCPSATAGSYDILLDRPLEAAMAAGDSLFMGSDGCFNMAFHRDAIAFVNRPLYMPPAAAGVQSAVITGDGLSMRVTMQYDWKCQGLCITVDALSGVAILDENLAIPFLG